MHVVKGEHGLPEDDPLLDKNDEVFRLNGHELEVEKKHVFPLSNEVLRFQVLVVHLVDLRVVHFDRLDDLLVGGLRFASLFALDHHNPLLKINIIAEKV